MTNTTQVEKNTLRELEMEKWVIAFLIRSTSIQVKYSKKILESDFTEPKYQEMFKHIETEINLGRWVDLTMMAKTFGVEEVIGMDDYPTENPEVWLHTLRSLNVRRQAFELCDKIKLKLINPKEYHEDILQELSLSNIELSKLNLSVETANNLTVVDEMDKMMRKALENGGILGDEIFGIKKLDRALGGLEETDFCIVAGRPGMGKSVMVVNAIKYGIEHKKRIVVWSLEMSANQIAMRVIAALGGGKFQDLKAGKIKDKDAFTFATNAFMNSRLLIIDKGGVTIDQISNTIISEHEKEPIDLLMIDHLGLVKDQKKNKYESQTYVSGQCKVLAKNLKKPLVGLNQLSRANAIRSDKRPNMSDLRDTGAYEQDADKIIGIYRPSYYVPRSHDRDEMIIMKNRSGETATCMVDFDFEQMLFLENPNKGVEDYFSQLTEPKLTNLVDVEIENPF